MASSAGRAPDVAVIRHDGWQEHWLALRPGAGDAGAARDYLRGARAAVVRQSVFDFDSPRWNWALSRDPEAWPVTRLCGLDFEIEVDACRQK